jgi:hypothetical protein
MTSPQYDSRIVRRARSTGFQPSDARTNHLDDRLNSKKENPTKPLIDWLARKLGHGRGERTKQTSSRRATTAGVPKGILNRNNANDPPSLPLPRARQRSTAPAPSIRLSTTRPASTRTRHSGRSYQPSSIFSPNRHRACPRASFITRSSASPTHSPSLSPSSSSQSLASSYLALEDPDSRSYITSRSLPDDNASTHPIPPSRAESPVLSIAGSLPSSIHFQAQLLRGTIHTSSYQSQSLKNRSRSASQSTSTSSYGSPNKTSRSIASTKPTTIFTTESEVALGLGQPLAQIAQPPRFLPGPTDEFVEGGARSRGIIEAGSLPAPIQTFIWSSLTAGSSRMEITSTRTTTTPGVYGSMGRAADSTPPSPSSPMQRNVDRQDFFRTSHGHPFQVPGYSFPRAEFNPSPGAEPRANASTHTLASSNFADTRRNIHLEDQAFALSPTESLEPSYVMPPPATVESFGGNEFNFQRPSVSQADRQSSEMVGGQSSENLAVPHTDVPIRSDVVGGRSHASAARNQNDIPVGYTANDTNREFARILGAVSQLDCDETLGQQMDERASVIGLRGRSGSWGSDVSRFSWAPVTNTKPTSETTQFTGPNQANKPPSFTKSALGKPLSIKSSA